MPNDEISKGFETVLVLTVDGESYNGFILNENDDTLSLGIANGKQVDIPQDDIEMRKPMKASSMPEGLIKTIAPIEFLDLIEYLKKQTGVTRQVRQDGWIRANSKLKTELRQHGEFKEISRDAEIQIPKSFSNSEWNQNAHLFLDPIKPVSFDFAFHSELDAANPSVLIRLPRESEVRYMWLQNRIANSFHARGRACRLDIARRQRVRQGLGQRQNAGRMDNRSTGRYLSKVRPDRTRRQRHVSSAPGRDLRRVM